MGPKAGSKVLRSERERRSETDRESEREGGDEVGDIGSCGGGAEDLDRTRLNSFERDGDRFRVGWSGKRKDSGIRAKGSLAEWRSADPAEMARQRGANR